MSPSVPVVCSCSWFSSYSCYVIFVSFFLVSKNLRYLAAGMFVKICGSCYNGSRLPEAHRSAGVSEKIPLVRYRDTVEETVLGRFARHRSGVLIRYQNTIPFSLPIQGSRTEEDIQGPPSSSPTTGDINKLNHLLFMYSFVRKIQT